MKWPVGGFEEYWSPSLLKWPKLQRVQASCQCNFESGIPMEEESGLRQCESKMGPASQSRFELASRKPLEAREGREGAPAADKLSVGRAQEHREGGSVM